MPKIKPSKTLEDEGIDIKHSPFEAEECPHELRGLFQLVHDVKSLRLETFARTKIDPLSKSSQGPRIQAAFDYDKWLYERADTLAACCSDPDLPDKHETEWVKVLHPAVLLRFDRDGEDRAKLHHCFVCRCHYPQRSRPLINRQIGRSEHSPFSEGTETCNYPEKHRNLPNLNSQMELAWYDDDNLECDIGGDVKPAGEKENISPAKNLNKKGREIPDTTIGLCTYSLQNSPWKGNDELLKLDQVRLFDRGFLSDLQQELGLPVPNRVADKKTQNSAPQFAFGIWEAKSAIGKSNTLLALMQSASKVKTMLWCQQQVYEKSSLNGIPLAWYFNSVGSRWTVYGCYIEKNPRVPQSPRYVLTHLWDGELREHEKALQLLYIMDMIAIWADYSYKPSICLCLGNLEALIKEKSKRHYPNPEEKPRIEKLELNKINFPWLLNPHWNTSQTQDVVNDQLSFSIEQLSLTPGARKSTKHRSTKLYPEQINSNRPTRSLLQTHKRGRSNEPISSRLSPNACTVLRSLSQNPPESNSGQKSPPGSAEEYVIPELHDYIWIQDRDPGNVDLLVLSINKRGAVTNPIVAFGSHDWQNGEFRQLVRHERHRWHSSVDTTFLSDKKQKPYLRKIILEQINCPPSSEIQVCIILPLQIDRYKESLRKISEEDDVFQPVEDLLKIPDLLKAIQRSADEWCLCKRPNNEYSPDMILCDNMNCKIGWYHKECLDMEEGDGSDFWLCPMCEASDSSKHHYSKDSDIDYDEDLYQECTDRVQMTKAIAKEWARHKWPNVDELLKKMERISRRLDFDSSVEYRLPGDADSSRRNPPGCWAVSRVLRKEPKMIKVVPSGMDFAIGDPSPKIITALRRSRQTRPRVVKQG